MVSDAQKRQAELRRKRWNKAEQPYFKCCLTCALSCTMTIKYAGAGYDIFSCPKKDRGEAIYPYKWAEMLKEHEQQEKERELNGKMH